MIFVVIVGGVAWLLAQGFTPSAAFGILAGTGALTSMITGRLTATPPAAR